MSAFAPPSFSRSDIEAELARRSQQPQSSPRQAIMAELARRGEAQVAPAESLIQYGVQETEGRRPELNIPAMDEGPDTLAAGIAFNLKKNQHPAFAAMSSEQQVSTSRRLAEEAIKAGQITPEMLGGREAMTQRAAARMRGEQSGSYSYGDDTARERDRQLLSASTEGLQGQEMLRRAANHPFERYALAAAGGASFGLSPVVRGAVDPSTKGLEAAGAEVDPLGTSAAAVAGGFIPGMAAGSLGAKLAGGLVSEAAAPLVKAGVGLAGAWAGGQATAAPATVLGTVQEGGGVGDVAANLGKQVTLFPTLLAKAAAGEDLTPQDRVALAMGVLALGGGAKDILKTHIGESNVRAQAALEQARLDAQQIAQQALGAMGGGEEGHHAFQPTEGSQVRQDTQVVSRIAQDDPAVRVKMENEWETAVDDMVARENPQLLRASDQPEAIPQGERVVHGENGEAILREEAPPPEKTLTPEQVAEFASKHTEDGPPTPENQAGEYQLQRGNIESLEHRGKFVLRDIPIEKFQIVNEPDRAVVEGYAQRAGGEAPPIVAGPPAKGSEPLATGKELLVTDGKHRLAAAALRGEKTVQALVPEWYAKQPEKPREALPPSRQRREDRYAQAKAALDKNPKLSIRALAEEIGLDRSNFGSARRLRDRWAKEQKPPEPAPKTEEKPTVVEAAPVEHVQEAPPPQEARPQPEPPRTQPAVVEQGGAEPFLEKWAKAETYGQRKALLKEAGPEVLDQLQAKLDQGLSDERLKHMLPSARERARGAAEPKPTEPEPKKAPPEPKEEPPPKERAQDLIAEVRRLAGTDTTKLEAYIRDLGDEDVISLLDSRRFKGATARVIRGEASSRGLLEGGAAASPVPAERVNTTPDTTTAPFRLNASLARGARAAASPLSPHRIIANLSRDLGLGGVGVAGARLLKSWAGGFYRVSPESIRLRLADSLDVHIHEIGHHLHKMLFQGGLTQHDMVGRRRLSATGLESGAFPARWRQELEAMGQALYGPKKPAAGYISEGWAELVRNIFTGNTDAEYEIAGHKLKVKDMASFKETMSMLARDWPEQLAALEKFKRDYLAYRAAGPITKAALYIRRDGGRDPEKWAWFSRLRTALTDRMYAMVSLKKDLGIDSLPADQDPHIVALRAYGRATGDVRRAMSHGMFDPRDPTKITGPSLEEVLRPVRHYLPEFETYLAVKRVLEKRKQGFKGLMPQLTRGELNDAVTEFEQNFPEFKKASEGFQKFNQWLIKDYAVAHGLITPESAARVVAKNLDYVTFRRVLRESQGLPGESTGAPSRFVETGTGVRRFPKESRGQQIDPPLESFMASMQGIMHRAQMNRVGQSLVGLFGKVAKFEEMPRFRLEMIAEDRGIDPTLSRADLINAFNQKGVRVGEAEGIGRWIDKIDRPMDVVKMLGEDVERQLKARIRDLGLDPEATELEPMLALVSSEDFMSFKPGFRVDKRSRQFSVLKDGVPTFWEAKNDALFRFLEGFENPAALHGFWKLLSVPRTVYRAGATVLNPSFFVINYLRDLTQAAIMTSAGKEGGFAGFSERTKARLRGTWQAFQSGDPGQMFLASGADLSGLFGEYIDPRTKKFRLERMFEKPRLIQLRGDNWQQKAVDFATTAPLWRMIGRVNERFELANRLAEFEANLAQSDVTRAMAMFSVGSPSKDQIAQARAKRSRADVEGAGQAAADITIDFQRGGTESMRINKYVPFFNASLQGGEKLARFIRRDPLKAVGQIFNYVLAPSLVAHYLARDDKKYWDIPYQNRDRYWHFRLGDVDGDGEVEYVKIPKPYGLGAFSVALERLLARVDGIDPITGKRGDPKAMDGMFGAMISEFRPPYYVPIIMPSLELYFNKSIWKDSEIVRQGEQTGPVEERGAERSSELARTMASFLHVAPPQVDHAIQGIFASLGQDVTQYAIDPALKIIREDLLGYEPRPTRNTRPSQIEFYPMLKRLIVEEPKTFSESMIRFWDAFKDAENAYRGWSHRKEDSGESDRYYAQHSAKIEAYLNLVRYKGAMDDLYKELNRLYRNREMPEKERRRAERQLIDEIATLARDGMADLDKPPAKEAAP